MAPIVNTGWRPRPLGRALFAQKEIWITSAGEYVDIADMDPQHLLNTLLYLERVAPQIKQELNPNGCDPAKWLVNTPLYQAMKVKLLERPQRALRGEVDLHVTMLADGHAEVYIR